MQDLTVTAESERGSHTSGWQLADYGSSALTEVRALCETYFGLTVEPGSPTARLLYWFRVGRIGPVTLGEIRFGDEVRLGRREPTRSYHVYIPLTGRMTTEHEGIVGTASIGRAVVHRPLGPATVDRIRAYTTVLVVQMDQAPVERHLQIALDRPVAGPIEVDPWLDLTERRGRAWLTMVRLLLEDVASPDGMVADPTTAEHLGAGVLAGFLSASEHPHRKELAHPDRYQWPRAVRRAVDAMQSDPAYPFTVVDLARVSEVGVRALQAAFHRHLGMSPMGYLRDLRLARAHEDLRQTRPGTDTVADVAHRWGFTHLGRFAAAYKRQYRVLPSLTLRA